MGFGFGEEADHQQFYRTMDKNTNSYRAIDGPDQTFLSFDRESFPEHTDHNRNMDSDLYNIMGMPLESDEAEASIHNDSFLSVATLSPISPIEYRNYKPDSAEDLLMHGVLDMYLGSIDDIDSGLDILKPELEDRAFGVNAGLSLKESDSSNPSFEAMTWSEIGDQSPYYPSGANNAVETNFSNRADEFTLPSWNGDSSFSSAFSGVTTNSSQFEFEELFNFDDMEMEPFQTNPLPFAGTGPAMVPGENPDTHLTTHRAPRRSARRSNTESLPSKRQYKANRQRIQLKKVRGRIKCDIDGCQSEYASASTVYRHRRNTHWSKSLFCARCRYPGCVTQLWAGTEEKAWDNLRTHQSQKHTSWAIDKTKEERCEMTEHLKTESS